MKMNAIKDVCKCTSNADNAVYRGLCSSQNAVFVGCAPQKFSVSAAKSTLCQQPKNPFH